jgi:cytochrome oxidase Cu insertion factor (SCO1/SenC/PrrC family)
MNLLRITHLFVQLIFASILYAIITTAQANPIKLGGDFELTSHKGEAFQLSEIKGKVGIIFFGFTHCPDVCPNTLLEIQRLIVALEDQAEHIRVLFISVDPKRDTPEILDSYVTYFNKNITGLTGSEEDIAKVLKQFNASVKFSGDTSSGTYNVEHTANLFLINKQGDIGSIILPRTPFAVLEQQVRKLIDE